MNEKTRITVVGLGCVGMSLAVLLGRTQDVVALDIDPARVAMVNSGRPTVIDPDMDEVMANETLSLVATAVALSRIERLTNLTHIYSSTEPKCC